MMSLNLEISNKFYRKKTKKTSQTKLCCNKYNQSDESGNDGAWIWQTKIVYLVTKIEEQ